MAAKDLERDEAAGIPMMDGGQGAHMPQSDAEFFLQLAPQTGLPRFAGFTLAPGKFPITGKVGSRRPPANEILAPALNEREGDVEPLDVPGH